MIQFETGKPKGERILAGIQWGDDGEMYYDVLHYYPCKGLKYPEGYYDQSGENVPDGAIKQFAEVNQDPFSNGQDYYWWAARNCDKCIKQSHYNERLERYIQRCAIDRYIVLRMMSDEPIAQRTIDICRKSDCPFRKEHWPKRKRKSKTANLPSLFD